MTYPEYLAFEAASEAKHEYVNGEIYVMAGRTDITACGEPLSVDVDAIYRDPLVR